MRKAGEEDDWKKNTRDRGGWKRLSDEAVKKLRPAPHPRQREKEEERDVSISLMIHNNIIKVHTQHVYNNWYLLSWYSTMMSVARNQMGYITNTICPLISGI